MKEYLSKSKYCKAIQCKKILWLDRYKIEEKEETARKSVLENGTKVGMLAKGLFGKYEDVAYNENLSIMVETTKELLNYKPNIITEASFEYNHNFCSVDILKNDKDGVEIYEVKSSTDIHDIYIDDIAYQYFILSKVGLTIKKANLVFINKEYIRHGELEIQKLFTIEDVTETIKEKQNEIEIMLKEIDEFMEQHGENNEPDMNLGMQCKKPYECSYWKYCTRDLPKPNVFDIANMRTDKKFERYNKGLISFEDLGHEEMNSKYLEQIDFELHNLEPKINKEAIRELMNSLKYPLYFIDFETFQLAIPEYEGTKPYQQLPFQYSLHIMRKENGEIEHKEFLAQIDDEEFMRHFAESMIHDIPDNGRVIIYNNSFEPARINEMAKMYPDLAKELQRINSQIVDFLVPFRNRDYYMKEFQGSYSIKKVLPALYPNDSELDYHQLSVVHNGEEASDTFLSLRGKSKEEQEVLRKGLLEYCRLDTYAMVKIWQKFKEILQE